MFSNMYMMVALASRSTKPEKPSGSSVYLPARRISTHIVWKVAGVVK
jgi:hypothetical protein